MTNTNIAASTAFIPAREPKCITTTYSGKSRGRMERIISTVALIAVALLAFLSCGCDAAEAVMSWSSNLLIPDTAGAPVIAPLALVDGAVESGAVCLDGSPPGYYLQRGFGTGATRWLIHLEGGAWCTSLDDCAARAGTKLGSTRLRPLQERLSGLLSNSSEWNPEFYNWNRVFVPYCDGASFAGEIDSPVDYKGQKLYFRGLRVWKAVMEELKKRGMADATHALLTGCSAGGLSTYIHCDRFSALFEDGGLPRVVKCMADGGFFLDVKDVQGKYTLRGMFQSVFELQGLHTAMPESCLDGRSNENAWECMFPQTLVRHTRTPLFATNALYDTWQIENVFVPASADPWSTWSFCKKDPLNCSTSQLATLNEYRQSLLSETQSLSTAAEGTFLNACFIHCQTPSASTWHGPTAPRINNVTMAEAVGAWFLERTPEHLEDGLYPSNPTCYDWQHKKTWEY